LEGGSNFIAVGVPGIARRQIRPGRCIELEVALLGSAFDRPPGGGDWNGLVKVSGGINLANCLAIGLLFGGGHQSSRVEHAAPVHVIHVVPRRGLTLRHCGHYGIKEIMLNPDDFKRSIQAIDALGETPAVLVKVTELANDPDSDISSICELLRNDGPLVADINVLLSDGSAQQLSSSRLRDLLRNTGDTSGPPSSPGPNTVLFPN
jgi:hypothetical protein